MVQSHGVAWRVLHSLHAQSVMHTHCLNTATTAVVPPCTFVCRAHLSWEARAAACRKHIITSTKPQTSGSGSGDYYWGFDPASLKESELEACYQDTANMCYVEIDENGRPACYTSSDSYEFSQLLCPCECVLQFGV